MDEMEITIYANGRDLHCWRAKRLLSSKGYAFEVADVTFFQHGAKASI